MRARFDEAKEELNVFRQNNDQDGFNVCVAEIRAEADSIFEADMKFAFTAEQREIYTTIGGYPSLDGEYSVFGEVVEGWDVLDKIAAVETDKYDRPVADVQMKKVSVGRK